MLGPERNHFAEASSYGGWHMELWELEAREELRDLLATYYKLGDSGKLKEQAALFEPDGVVELYGRGTYVGREAIAEAYGGLNRDHVADSSVTYIRHHSSNYTVEFQSRTEASGEGYWLLLNNNGLFSWGRCRDQYRRADGGPWQFARRLVRGDVRN
ncbi:MAG TPA: nuclear transport factor 2 family protein [Acidimicrobiales bacterium]|nr:nuclear transport factor 2 family protein [Acidimicrobiales bacterium]